MSGLLYTEDEMDRLLVLNKVRDCQLTQKEAARQLRLSTRQVRLLLTRISLEGTFGIKPKPKAPKPSFSNEFKTTVINLVRERYNDFGPTFAC